MHEEIKERFLSKIEKTDYCWNWNGTTLSNGYGQFYYSGKKHVYAHRISYELHVGGIPKGLTIHHTCRNKHCVNPEHLEPVTIKENVLRGMSVSAQNARKKHCPHGHTYNEENTHISPSGRRICKKCCCERRKLPEYKEKRKIYNKEYRKKNKDEINAKQREQYHNKKLELVR